MMKHVYSLTIVLSFLFLSNVKCDPNDERFRMLYSKSLKCDHNKSLNLDVSETKIYFYDFVNDVNISSKIDEAAELVKNAIGLNSSRRLIIFVPGFKSHINKGLEEVVRQSFKNVSNIYLIIVDHSAYTYETKEKLKSYLRSVYYSYYIGNTIGKFLADVSRDLFLPDNIHIIGHSLGGHMVSYAAETFTEKTKERFWRITGLDPAGPCFSTGSLDDHIRSGIGKYIEVYHCNAGHFGTTQTIADTDFFFNYKGKIQPNCVEANDEDTEKCYHKACVRYYMKTIHNPEIYIARSCTSYRAFKEGLCRKNETAVVGYHNPGDVRGIYYISTDEKSDINN